MKKSSEDFIHQSGRYKGRLKQKELQTGKPKGTFKSRDEHPDVSGLYFFGYDNAVAKERWMYLEELKEKNDLNARRQRERRKPTGNAKKKKITSSKIIESKKSLDEFVHQSGKNKGCFKQKELQTGYPLGTFKLRDEHPFVDGLFYRRFQNGGEYWMTLDALEEYIGKQKPKKSEYGKSYYLDVAKKRDYLRHKIQHIYDWRDSAQGRASLERDRLKRNRERNKEWIDRDPNNRIKSRLRVKKARKRKKLKGTKALIKFYQTHDIPDYLWHKDEFANEANFQAALEHVIVNKLGLNIERWTYLEDLGIPDIYLPELDLIVEVKLLSKMWKTRDVVYQSLRYLESSPTVIVSLDGEPKDWLKKTFEGMITKRYSFDDFRIKKPPWFTPEQLFDFLEERRANLDHE
jgi:hypothetical protein